MPYGANKKEDRRSTFDVHRYNLGASIACLRHGLKSIKPNKKIFISVGRGNHLRPKDGKNLREELVKTRKLGHAHVSFDEKNEGRMKIKKRFDYSFFFTEEF